MIMVNIQWKFLLTNIQLIWFFYEMLFLIKLIQNIVMKKNVFLLLLLFNELIERI